MTFDPEGTQIIQIGEHDGPAFYAELAKSYNVSRIGQRREQKPACCGEDGWPSVGPAKKARP